MDEVMMVGWVLTILALIYVCYGWDAAERRCTVLRWKLKCARRDIDLIQSQTEVLRLSMLQALPDRDPKTGRFRKRYD